MNDQAAVQKLLHQKLTEIQAKNPSYSLRAFASKLKIGAGPLSQILAGSRKVSQKMAHKLCDALLLDPQERIDVLKHFDRNSNASELTNIPSASLDKAILLNADRFKLVSEWYYFGILSLTQTSNFKSDLSWIAQRLGISKVETSTAIDRLTRLGMLEKKSGKWTRTTTRYKTNDDVSDLSIRRSHFQSLELAKKSLEQDPSELRDFTTITFPTNPDQLPKAKELLRKFQQDLAALMMKTKNPTEVYRLSLELFPLTQSPNQEKKS